MTKAVLSTTLKIFVLVLAIGMFAGSASATPLFCPTNGSYADLLATNAAGGCYVQDKLFSNFVYDTSSTDPMFSLAASQFKFNVIANRPLAIGFQFAFSLTALPGTSNDVQIGYLVTGPNIVGNHMAMTGNAIGNAVALITETYCKGGPVAGCPAANAAALNTYVFPGVASLLVDDAKFAPVGSLGVIKDINVSAGSGGFAHVSGLTETVEQIGIPEPASMALAGGALLALGVLSRRKRA